LTRFKVFNLPVVMTLPSEIIFGTAFWEVGGNPSPKPRFILYLKLS